MVKIYLFVSLYALIFIVVSSQGNVVTHRDACGELINVDKAVVIDGPFHEDCILEFRTQEDRILAFSVVDGDVKEASELFTIHDGISRASPILLAENQMILDELSRKDLPSTLYSTQSTASVRFTKTPSSKLLLKIQKAVSCSLNVGPETQCGRVVDEVSCYCANFANKNHPDHTMSCIDNNMTLVSFENRTEEEFVQRTWSTQIPFWTSLTDARRDGTWVWEGTMTILGAGDYTHWFPGRPILAKDNEEDCMLYGGNTFFAYWGDVNCITTLANAICEAHP
ncbi:CD209 antigen-like [Daphnia pulicaria]|uniref:CD209 antigen-like n=1 Tax=Daphnia pulicaria TaxID=35523 RepID=UPI001EEBB986|nr:CD209 antigen-like [Daphnia pulicaria]